MSKKPLSNQDRKVLFRLIIFFTLAFGLMITIVTILFLKLTAMCGSAWTCQLH